MRYDLPFRACTYLLVLTGAVTLTLAEINLQRGSFLYLPVAFLGVGLSWLLLERPGGRGRGLPRLWANLLGGLAILFSLVDALKLTGDGLLALAHLLLLFQLIKLWQRKSERDYLQLVVLSFMHVGAAAAITIELTFSLALFAYMVLAAFTLTFATIRSQSRQVQATGGSLVMVGRQGRLGVLLLVGGMSLYVVVATMAIFLLLPRTGADYLGFDLGLGSAVTGFGDRVQLGDISSISSSTARAMTARVSMVVPGDGRPRLEQGLQIPDGELRLRGKVYDTYEDGGWDWSGARGPILQPPAQPERYEHAGRRYHPTFRLQAQPLLQGDVRQGFEDLAVPGARRLLEVEIVQERSRGARIFTLPVTVRVVGERGGLGRLLEVGSTGELLRPGEERHKVRYVLMVRPPPLNRDALLAAGAGEDGAAVTGSLLRPDRATYLRLPEHLEASGRLRALALQVAGHLESPLDRARALEAYLQREFSYSTEGLASPAGMDPVEHFLFTSRQGHCEYFASALTLLCRSIGVPARLVSGFVSTEFNELSGTYTVRQNNAHAWVEVHVDGLSAVQPWRGPPVSTGWVTLDATPPGALQAPAGGVMAFLAKLGELFQVNWDSHVLGYERDNQVRLFRTLMASVRELPRGLLEDLGGWRSGARKVSLTPVVVAVLGIVAFLLLVTGRSRPGGRGPRGAPQPGVPRVGFYRRALRQLERTGLSRQVGETPRQLLCRAETRQGQPLPPLARLTEIHQEVCFAGQPLTPRMRQEADQHLQELRGLLRSPPAPPEAWSLSRRT